MNEQQCEIDELGLLLKEATKKRYGDELQKWKQVAVENLEDLRAALVDATHVLRMQIIGWLQTCIADGTIESRNFKVKLYGKYQNFPGDNAVNIIGDLQRSLTGKVITVLVQDTQLIQDDAEDFAFLHITARVVF